jgi:O-acetyl-ADP-ribose deacetylase (regulator of RNase III)
MHKRLSLLYGDLTTMKVDAIVCSADENLTEGGPVHRAVHAAAGPELAQEVRLIGRCPVGGAKLSRGHKLAARYVIHTVVPTWMDGGHGEGDALASCYRNVLALASAKGFRTIALPSLGSGSQPQIPLAKAAPIAIHTILDYLNSHPMPEHISLVCIESATYKAHLDVLRAQEDEV